MNNGDAPIGPLARAVMPVEALADAGDEFKPQAKSIFVNLICGFTISSGGACILDADIIWRYCNGYLTFGGVLEGITHKV